MNLFRKFRPVALILLLNVSTAGAAGPPLDANDLDRSGRAQRYEFVLGNASIHAGGAAIVVHASASVVRSIVMDFASYERFMPNFQRSRVIARKPEGTDVYLQVPILNGAVKIWTVARFAPLHTDSEGEHIEAFKLDRGNIKDFQARWHIKALDASRTLLRLELLVVPNFPVPKSLVTSALADSADNGVTACRKRAEQAASSQK